ncbi:hypothetical protein A2U01_0063275, partial [Trifolium medium]|nr:hypothetical protein [Trifolium medium]
PPPPPSPPLPPPTPPSPPPSHKIDLWWVIKFVGYAFLAVILLVTACYTYKREKLRSKALKEKEMAVINPVSEDSSRPGSDSESDSSSE